MSKKGRNRPGKIGDSGTAKLTPVNQQKELKLTPLELARMNHLVDNWQHIANMFRACQEMDKNVTLEKENLELKIANLETKRSRITSERNEAQRQKNETFSQLSELKKSICKRLNLSESQDFGHHPETGEIQLAKAKEAK